MGTYATVAKTARMTATRDQIDAGGAAGRLELGTTAMALVLATITLGYPGASTGTVAGAVLTLAGFPRSDTAADATGKATVARLRTSAAADVYQAMTVGLNSTAAPAHAVSTAVALGVYRTSGANIYKCVTAGTTGAASPPTGTGTGITDGSAVWDYYCIANAEIMMDNLEIVVGQNVTISAFTLTHAT